MTGKRVVQLDDGMDFIINDSVTNKTYSDNRSLEKLINSLYEQIRDLEYQLEYNINQKEVCFKDAGILGKENEKFHLFFDELKKSGYWKDSYLTEQDWTELKIWIDMMLEK